MRNYIRGSCLLHRPEVTLFPGGKEEAGLAVVGAEVNVAVGAVQSFQTWGLACCLPEICCRAT